MKTNDADLQRGSGLFIGSEPLEDIHHRGAMSKDDNDSGKDKLSGDTGDDDSTDTGDSDGGDTGDSDSTDKGDSDGKD